MLKRKLGVANKFVLDAAVPMRAENIVFASRINNNISYVSKNKFRFLNISHYFDNKIDWSYMVYGKLWAYNLNYFEYINQSDITKKESLRLIESFSDSIKDNRIGLEPYPLSLRIINWIKFFVQNNIDDKRLNQLLWSQLQLLSKNKEYHLLGNHLLENGFALLFGAYYFDDKIMYQHAKQIILDELNEQILRDGAHFELSPMYHSLMTYRVLDVYNLVFSNELFAKELLQFLKQKVELMLSFLKVITFKNGDIPLVNDSAFGITPKPSQLFSYANQLELQVNDIQLSDSGYRKFYGDNYEFFIDVGEVGPTYQPGHAHADTFSFLLYISGRPVIIDTGTSTYEINETRFYERSTYAHNTVSINKENSSQVWAGHRVGIRANATILENNVESVIAEHNGYEKKFGVKHKRSVECLANYIVMNDDILGNKGEAHFHFAPNEYIEVKENLVIGQDFILTFENATSLAISQSYCAFEFNEKKDINKVSVSFENNLTTKIDFL
ncbi:alginate lyase family protein [Pasteurella skyensis]|uniref:Alginate lyase family protein n=1 Tax=Phocoenobacter skyensis TaxID=97481 RepID=A0AAJ6P0S2_9PAST|nr:alginate lyase family protein [Pasteurella skyensis]MDP8162123.1 alginate lyase family protein [Pasteurella skyensis]MDP8172982.1 alginate lyase family protein [Pasteurella skyensis]MDP8179493.1 alginate lyase family protein [Pasteurella skyensis]MDP8183653.1 alginate lyase family protein [Pasteurella skyensis]MDP8189598.1 alginate lyase family protein [Pasteurella skyensis]